MFIPKESFLGRKVKLNHDINTTIGTFTKGSVMTVTGYSQISKMFDLRDNDSGEILFSCSRSNYDNTDRFNFID